MVCFTYEVVVRTMAWLIGFLVIVVGFIIAWADNPIYGFITHSWQALGAFMILGGMGILATRSIMFFIDYAKRK